jgi:hypothetical protein
MEEEKIGTMHEKLKEFNGKMDFVKFHTICAAEAEFERRKLHEEICKVSGNKWAAVFCVCGDIAILEFSGKDDWNNRYPYGFMIYDDKLKKWVRGLEVCSSPDKALLLALGQKYDGLNAQFAKYAAKMLGIE